MANLSSSGHLSVVLQKSHHPAHSIIKWHYSRWNCSIFVILRRIDSSEQHTGDFEHTLLSDCFEHT
jgi:hypothetical protein